MADDKEGVYCRVCGGIVPEGTTVRRILIDGKETGIDKLDFILGEVAALGLSNEQAIKDELLKRVKVFNYVPTKKTDVYASALYEAYRAWLKDR
jgi:hypothetical protein